MMIRYFIIEEVTDFAPAVLSVHKTKDAATRELARLFSIYEASVSKNDIGFINGGNALLIYHSNGSRRGFHIQHIAFE
jgi:hypothetical protein